ncbi:hypothetical protein [uncultured Cohaesibacter sp.]|uniref:LEM-3-like GIY-YIG domain-containing protein n=1 Tax=uncultured Cohaesibacter sp. TaxID=1002546 RepID=UPI0029C69473|nr:hypothetical protein [uncultured Cohaesibacter sp.]
MSTKSFSETVIKSLNFYVYRLIDPRNGETFYVGKGKGNRVFKHVEDALKHVNDEDSTTLKFERIREIKRALLDVQHVIHRHGLDEKTAFEVEGALIDAYPGLSNQAGGHYNGARGTRHVNEIASLYDLPELIPDRKHKLLLININSSFDNPTLPALYEAVRYAWRVNVQRARQSDYVLAVVSGVVRGAFIADEWAPATPEFFPERTPLEQDKGRFAFKGRPAPDNIQNHYAGELIRDQVYRGKRIAKKELKHVQNPVLYWPK